MLRRAHLQYVCVVGDELYLIDGHHFGDDCQTGLFAGFC